MGLLVALSLGGKTIEGRATNLDEEGAGDGAWALLEDLWAEEKDGGRWKVALGVALKEMVSSPIREACSELKMLTCTVFQVASEPLPRIDSILRLFLNRDDISKASAKDLVPALYEVSKAFSLCSVVLQADSSPLLGLTATPPRTTLLPLFPPPAPSPPADKSPSDLLQTSLRMRVFRQVRYRSPQPIDPHDARRNDRSREVLVDRRGDGRDGCGWREDWRKWEVELGKDEAGSDGGFGGLDGCSEEACGGGRGGVGEWSFNQRVAFHLSTSH